MAVINRLVPVLVLWCFSTYAEASKAAGTWRFTASQPRQQHTITEAHGWRLAEKTPAKQSISGHKVVADKAADAKTLSPDSSRRSQSTKQSAILPVTRRSGPDRYGTVSLKNNYVFSTGTQIDDKPVLQLWARAAFNRGWFVDLWSNVPLADGNPRRSAEIDYSIGYRHDFGVYGKVTAMLTYYDIQTPDVFNFNNDAWGPVLRWQKGNFFTEGMYFFVDGERDGFRILNSYTHPLSDRLSVRGKLTVADGPFANQAALVGKLGVSYTNPAHWVESVGLEVSEILYAEDHNDPRGFATTLSFSKDLF